MADVEEPGPAAGHLESVKNSTGWNVFFRSVAVSNYETIYASHT